jgi:hypothetical protein
MQINLNVRFEQRTVRVRHGMISASARLKPDGKAYAIAAMLP